MDPYRVLGIPPSASAAELRAAYRRQARRRHPDHGGSTEDMARLNAAYAALRNDRAGRAPAGKERAGTPTQDAPARCSPPDQRHAGASAWAAGRPALEQHLDQEAAVVAWLALLVAAGVLVRLVAVLLGPPLDSSYFLQLWAAVMLAWLAHDECGRPWR